MYEAVVLAGGLGTRLRSITAGAPKAMVEVSGEPVLYKVMKSLETASCSRIILALGYKAHEIINKVKIDRPVSCEVKFVVEESALGTGGAVVNASQYVSSDSLLVVNGDTLCGIDYQHFYTKSLGSDCKIAVYQVDNAHRYGRVSVDNKAGYILAFEEKGVSGPGLISVGVYFIAKQFLPEAVYPFSIERDFFMSHNKKIGTYRNVKGFVDIGLPDDYYWACANSKIIESWM